MIGERPAAAFEALEVCLSRDKTFSYGSISAHRLVYWLVVARLAFSMSLNRCQQHRKRGQLSTRRQRRLSENVFDALVLLLREVGIQDRVH